VTAPGWLSRLVVDTMHAELLSEHGGLPGIREGGDDLIEAALARPKNRAAYEPDSDLADLAAAYAFGLASNHGWLDGNKRVAFAAAATFLLVNGVRLTASEPDAYHVMIELVQRKMSEQEFAGWVRAHSARPLP
jgi:death on curing protein